MTRLYDDPADFTDDMLAGFADAHARYVIAVPGGVVRATTSPPGKVAVVVGGGSGHYPAFCGVVGPGFADGAVVGNVFTSPSADDAYSVAKAAWNGGGVLITSGNYAGDVMHFTEAQQRLVAEGIDARVLFVTDDVASAPPEDATKRRGIAGDFVVFKVAAAAAEAGYDIAEVERVGRLANDRTRTLGVAFSGCTLPGADHPLFTVPEGRMGLGLGIHGEPGVSEGPLPRAADLARQLVDGALAELDLPAGARVGVILNGLGATKYEELFVVWRTVARLLAERDLVVVDPEVGELVTSLDMAGCSLTVVALDDELERFWTSGADTPAYRKGVAAASSGERRVVATEPAGAGAPVQEVSEGSDASRASAATAVRILDAMAEVVVAAEDELGRIDAVAGDGDHGRGMVKGVVAAAAAAHAVADRGGGVASVLAAAGHDWAARAGGTSGALWGAALTAIGERLGDTADDLAATDVAAALRAGFDAIATLGGASVGDKTMLDALAPFVDELDARLAAGHGLAPAWAAAAEAAQHAAADTAAMRPRVGRARPLAERSVGTPDAGATSLAMCLTAAAGVLGEER